MKRSVKIKYMHLKEQQQLLWFQLSTQEEALYLNIKIITEIILVIQAISVNVEQGFSTLRKNLRENHLSMSNEGLNQILTVKINLPMLRNLIEDCDNVIINEYVERYYDRKMWRRSLRKEKEVEKINQDIYDSSPPTKKRVII